MKAHTSVEIHQLIAERRSPRSFDPNAAMSTEELTALLEAARWAPSASNLQPWRFIVGLRDSAEFNEILELLVPGNKAWAHRASALIAVAGTPAQADGKAIPTFMYDCGLAVSQLTLEAQHRGFVSHQMAGFDHDEAKNYFEGVQPVVIIAVGKQGEAEQLEAPLLERENAPRSRKPLDEIVLKGLSK